jgi:hypothetical protein
MRERAVVRLFGENSGFGEYFVESAGISRHGGGDGRALR